MFFQCGDDTKSDDSDDTFSCLNLPFYGDCEVYARWYMLDLLDSQIKKQSDIP